MADYEMALPGAKVGGFNRDGLSGLIGALFVFLLLVITALILVIAIKDNEASDFCPPSYVVVNATNEEVYPTPPSSSRALPRTTEPPLITETTGAATTLKTPSTPISTPQSTTLSTTPRTTTASTTTSTTTTPSTTSRTTTTQSTSQTVAATTFSGARELVDEYCSTRDCVISAGHILEYIGTKHYNKCSTFPEYACANWDLNNPIPDHLPQYDAIKQTENEVEISLKKHLETSSINTPDMQNAEDYYTSCMNTTRIEETGLNPAMRQLVGDWPVLQPDWTDFMFQYDLNSNLQKAVKRDYPVFFDLFVGRKPTDVSQPMILIGEPILGMGNKDFYTNSLYANKLKAYEKLAQKTAILFGAEETQAKTEMTEMINFEVQLAQVMQNSPPIKGFPYSYSEFSISDLNLLTSVINWMDLVGKTVTGLTVNAGSRIGVLNKFYLTSMASLITKTKLRTLGNYITWRFLLENLDYLPQDFQTIFWWYEKTLYDTPSATSRWRKCLRQTVTAFPKTMQTLYYNYTTDNSDNVNMAGSIFEHVRAAINESLGKRDWLDPDTRRYALEKINSMGCKFLNDTTFTGSDYTNVSLNSEPFLFNLVRLRSKKAAQRLDMSPDAQIMSSWDIHPLSLKIYYDYQINKIIFPTAAFQISYYALAESRSINYAVIGTTLAYEMLKSVDQTGSKFDRSGNLLSGTWWSPSSIQLFTQKHQCLANRYGNFTIFEANLMVYQNQVANDTIRETAAVELALDAYVKWATSKSDTPLPGLQLADHELYFITYAQKYCGEIRLGKYTEYATSINMLPEPYRSNATLVNSPVFAETFYCSSVAENRDHDTCAIW